jgi:hypothetical protein
MPSSKEFKSSDQAVNYDPDAIPNFLFDSMKEAIIDTKECNNLKIDILERITF